MLDKLNELDAMGYAYYFQYTLNAYDSDIEPNLPKLENKLDTFLMLAYIATQIIQRQKSKTILQNIKRILIFCATKYMRGQM